MLGGLQDCLGDLNDIAVHNKLVVSVAGARGEYASEERDRPAFAAGFLVGKEHVRVKPLIRAAIVAGAAFATEKPFWK